MQLPALAIFTAILLAQGPYSRAEYRVFRLKIEKRAPASAPVADPAANPAADPAASPARFVDSTLDPDQYRGYFPVGEDEVVTYADTWRCRGRTDNKPHCPNPRDAASVEGPETVPAPAP